jgi:hypothetical protein
MEILEPKKEQRKRGVNGIAEKREAVLAGGNFKDGGSLNFMPLATELERAGARLGEPQEDGIVQRFLGGINVVDRITLLRVSDPRSAVCEAGVAEPGKLLTRRN